MFTCSTMAKYAIALSGLLATAAAFDASANTNVALYWGQASAGSQESLATYCESDAADIMILSFMTAFPGTDDLPTLNFASACTDTFSDGLLECDQIAADIQTCQSLGKTVLLSMGGSTGSYGFTTDDEAEEFAGTLWNMFGEGSADERPFGDAVVDGFDFDIENNNNVGYAALATKLRSYFAEGNKTYYLSAAPQCVYPDASVGDALENADFDFAFIQFYNNDCEVGSSFNWDTWVDYAQNTSPNKDIKLFLGLPGSATAATSGYVDIDTITSTLADIGDDTNFGGVMLWDASQGFTNTVDGESFVEAIKDALDDMSGTAATATTATTDVAAVSSTTSATVETTTTSSSVGVSIVSTTSTPAAVSTSSTPAVVTSSTPAVGTSSTPAAVGTSSTPAVVPTSSSTLTAVGISEVEDNTSLNVITSTFVVKGASDDQTSSTTATSSSKVTIVTSTVVVAPAPAPETTSGTTSTSTTQSPAPESTSTTTQAPSSVPETTATSPSTFVEVTSNTFTKSAGSTLKTVIVSSTTSSTAASTSSTSVSSGCNSLTGSDKASCLNAQYAAGQFAGSADSCTNGEIACSSSGGYAVCNWGEWAVLGCAAGTTCYAAPEGDDVFISCNWPQNEKHKRNVEHAHHDHA